MDLLVNGLGPRTSRLAPLTPLRERGRRKPKPSPKNYIARHLRGWREINLVVNGLGPRASRLAPLTPLREIGRRKPKPSPKKSLHATLVDGVKWTF